MVDLSLECGDLNISLQYTELHYYSRWTILNAQWNNSGNILSDALRVKVTLLTICQRHTACD